MKKKECVTKRQGAEVEVEWVVRAGRKISKANKRVEDGS